MNVQKVAIIGGGISGLSIAHCLKNKYLVKVFEKESRPGGLIKCDVVKGNLYHMVGGHIFNSRREDVMDWFWSFFDKESEFTKSIRNAAIYLDKPIGYPIENHLYQLDEDVMKSVIDDLLFMAKANYPKATNFEEFLKYTFGETLYQLYFKPYNEKIWNKDLSKVPLTWLEGKLPMPSIKEILYNNFNREKEMNMVHSSFFYPKKNGSQFLADRLAEGLTVVYNTEINSLERKISDKKWIVNENEEFDVVIYAGNIKDMPTIIRNTTIGNLEKEIENLEYHGTTSVLCEVDSNTYSWIYLPDNSHSSHRIICTGNFSEHNNRKGIRSATIEFTDYLDKGEIIENLKKIPYSPKYIAHKYTKYTYPIQDANTREVIERIKKVFEPNELYLLGRFAEWEYYNMDAAVGAAIDLSKKLLAN